MSPTEEEYEVFQKTGKWPKKKKTPKYKNKRVSKEESADGRSYHSKGEYKRSLELQALQACGAISNLTFQPKFILLETPDRVTWSGDFMYRRKGDVSLTVEDYKDIITAEFKVKWALVRALFGFEFNFILTGKCYDKYGKRPSVGSKPKPSGEVG